MPEPYIREELAATRNGVPDPVVEVEGWLDELQDAVAALHGEFTEDRPTSEQAYELLALWGKLKRVRPELIQDCGGTQELARADALLASDGPELSRRALRIMNPAAWLDVAGELEASVDELVDATTEVEQAVALLEDLDDAEVVLAAAGKQGVLDAELEAGVERCVQWLLQNADLFFAASVYVQAVGMAMRGDLEELDYDLAATALKFVQLLDAAAEAEAELALSHVKPLPAEVVKRLYEQYLKENARGPEIAASDASVSSGSVSSGSVSSGSVSNSNLSNRPRRFRTAWALPPEAPATLAADAPAAAPEKRLRWRSPGGEFFAEMYVPTTPSRRGDDEILTIVLYRQPDESFAEEWAGQPLQFGGAEPSRLDAQATATVHLGELRAADELSLNVGEAHEEWQAIFEE